MTKSNLPTATSQTLNPGPEIESQRKVESANLIESLWNRASSTAISTKAEDETTPLLNQETVYYLAYGSNLSASTFLGRRGIRPLSAQNVLVPGFALVFDLPGIPYLEPCFANLNQRGGKIHEELEGKAKIEVVETYLEELKGLLASGPTDDEKRWETALIGVVYEVTKKDFAKIIMTEGGGEGYADVEVDCFVLPPQDLESTESSVIPTGSLIRAHTLLAPKSKTNENSRAQPSPRYLNLLVTGANEHHLPQIYIDYLTNLHAYRRTTYRQNTGAFVLGLTWAVPMLMTSKLGQIFVDPETGRVAPWVARLREALMGGMWFTYRYFYRWVFGDGERTIGDDKVVRSGKLMGAGEVGGGVHGLATDNADVTEGLRDAEGSMEEAVAKALHLGGKH